MFRVWYYDDVFVSDPSARKGIWNNAIAGNNIVHLGDGGQCGHIQWFWQGHIIKIRCPFWMIQNTGNCYPPDNIQFWGLVYYYARYHRTTRITNQDNGTMLGDCFDRARYRIDDFFGKTAVCPICTGTWCRHNILARAGNICHIWGWVAWCHVA